MGADIRLAVVPRCKLTPKRLAEIKKMIVCDGVEDFDGDDVRHALEDYVAGAYDNSREIYYLTLRGAQYYVTGGMSWGDSPTDAYGALNILGNLFFNKLEKWSVEDMKNGEWRK